MSFNLLDAAKGLFTNELVGKASSYLGESESGVAKAISGILPTVIGGLANKANSGGSHEIAQMASEHHSSGLLGGLGNFFGNDGGGLLNKGAGIIGSLFGDKLGGLTGLISNFAGVKSSTSSSLLSMAAPAILGLLGKHAASSNMNAGGLASFLGSQAESVKSAMPSGFNLSSVLGDWGGSAKAAVSNATGHATHYAEEAVEKTSGGLKWLLPLLLLAGAALIAWYFFKDGCNGKAGAGHDGTDTTQHMTTTGGGTDTSHSGGTTTTTTTSAGTIDSTGNFVYNEGQIVDIKLPNGEMLKVGSSSFEAKLVAFLNDKSQVVDTVKGNWFDFTNVRFKTGSSDITESSMTQLKNMVTIAKAYPTAQFKVGGYTDNVGAEAGNVALSKKRAEAVAAQIKKMGITAAAITGAEGYGSQHPIADNATAEGKAQNRRVSVRVKAK